HQLHPVANSQHRHSEFPNAGVALRCALAVHTGRPATQDDAGRVDFRCGRIVPENLRKHLALADASRDDLRVLRAEIEDDDLLVHLLPMPTPCTVWKTLPSVLMAGAMMISVS